MSARFDRRRFLRGSLGGAVATVGLPVLDIMLDGGRVLAASKRSPPVRFGTFFWGGGVRHEHWLPATTGMDWELSDSLTPFADLRPYVTLVTGTNHANSSPGHIPARGIVLSSSHDLDRGVVGVGTYRGQAHPEPSIDSVVAEAWRGRTLFESIEIGICRKGPYRSNSSWRRGGRAHNRHEPSPQKLFDRLFGHGNGSVLAASTALDRSILDVVMAEARGLDGQLGHRDQLRMEQHLDGLRDIERRLQERERLAHASARHRCAEPERPMARDYGDKTGHEEKEAKTAIMADLLATALACDLSRVFSFEFSGTESHAVYWEVDVPLEHHSLTHKEANGGPDMRKVTHFIMQRYAQLARRLRDMPEGDGNVLDRTLILATSEHANAGKHDYTDHPYLLLGKAGGGLRAGLHHRDPAKGNQNAPRVLLTAAHAVGVKLAKLGQADGEKGRVAREPIGELLT